MLKTRFPSLYASTSLDIKALTVVILKLSVDSLSCFSAKLIIFPNFSSVKERMFEQEFSSYLDDFLLDIFTHSGEVFYHLDSHQRP